MNDHRTLAERLARMTEQKDAAAAFQSHEGTDPTGFSAIERIICAFSSLRHSPDREAARPVQFVWGHLDVVERLGSGSYGEVFRAFDKVLERDVALKLRGSDATSARAYIVEARRLAQVRHPHVLAVHGASVHDGRVGLWADLIEGQTLGDWIATDGPRSRDEVLACAGMLASALEAVHRAGLIHGDVKPGNIMHESDGRVVLMDFGSASESAGGGLRSLMGSPMTMAPEQLGGEMATAAVDIYALGVVMYFLACARYPLQAATIGQLSELHARAERPDFRCIEQRCGREPRRLMERMLVPDPGQRPSAADVLDSLRRIAEAPARRRRRIAIASVVAALTIALAASLVALVRIDTERKATALANARESSVRDFMRDFLASPKPSSGGAEARVVDVLADAVPVAERRFSAEPLVLAEVLGDIGYSLSGIGDHARGRPLLERALKLGREHAMNAQRILQLQIRLAAGDAYLAGGQAETATLQELFVQCRKQLGDAHETTVQAALELATLQKSLAHGEASETALRFVLAQRPADRYAADSQRLLAQIQLTSLLGEQQRWAEAEATMQEALAEARSADVENGSLGIILRMGEANLASRRSQFARAESLDQALLRDIERVYGVRHRNLRAALNQLAISQRMQGKTAEAIASLRRALDLAQAELGEDHYDVLTFRDNLASALFDAGDHAAARKLRESVLASKIRTRGERHPDTLLSAINLAEQYVEDGDGQRGFDLATDAAGKANAVFGADHLFSLEAREIAARGQLGLGRADLAREELQRVYAAKRKSLGDDDVYTLRSAGFLAAALAAQHDAGAAMRLLEPAMESLRKRFGDDQPDLRRMRAQAAALRARSTRP